MHFHQWKRRAFITLLVGVTALLLVAWVQQYKHTRTLQHRILLLEAEGAAAKIGQFIKEIERQIGWTTQVSWPPIGSPIEQRRFDALRLLRQVPAITDFAQLDATGKERVRSRRMTGDVVDSGADLVDDPMFVQALAHKVYYGPVYFRRQSEPFMKIAVAGTRRDAGVSVADFGVKLVWDVIKQIKVSKSGVAYVVDAQDQLIVHPDLSLVLRNLANCPRHGDYGSPASCYIDMSKLAQVRAARAGEQVQKGENIEGRKVLTAYAPVAPLGWLVFVELPVEEANEL